MYTRTQEWMWGEGEEASTEVLKSKLQEEEMMMRAKYEMFFGMSMFHLALMSLHLCYIWH